MIIEKFNKIKCIVSILEKAHGEYVDMINYFVKIVLWNWRSYEKDIY